MPRGGAREGAGRKLGSTKENNKTKNLNIRCTEEEIALIKEKAKQADMSVASYVMKKCLE